MPDYPIFHSQYSKNQIEASVGKNPVISDNGTWMVWDVESMAWVDTGIVAEGSDADVTAENIENALGYTPADDDDVAELKETLTSVEAVDKVQNRRLENLEAAAEGNLYRVEVDTEEAYSKSVPVGALPWAKLDGYGGKTQKVVQLAPDNYAKGTTVKTGRWYSTPVAISGTTSPTLDILGCKANHVYYLKTVKSQDFSIPDKTIRGRMFGKSPKGYPLNLYFESYIDTAPSGATDYLISFYPASNTTEWSITGSWYWLIYDLTEMFGAGNEPTSVDDPRIAWIERYAEEHFEYDAGSLVSADVSSVVSKDAEEQQIDALPIPSAVRALDGYGETGSVVDFANKTYTAPDGTVTDISDILADFDNNIKVEGGGSITFESTAKLPVPNQETYLIDIQEAIANG